MYHIGDKIGPNKIEFISKTEEKTSNNKNIYIFKCPFCNSLFKNTIDKISSGNTKSCGCLKSTNYIGKRYNNYIITEKTNERKSRHIVYIAKCDCGNFFKIPSNRINHTFSCGCKNSKGEALIQNILQQLEIKYETQKTFKNCLYNNNLMKFDFYLSDYNILIEYDGILHYSFSASEKSWSTKEKLIDTQNRDNYKDKWCQENNIYLIRIPYTDFDKINKQYIQEKIQQCYQHQI